MDYTLGHSGPIVELLVRAHLALEDLVGNEPLVWSADGPMLVLPVPWGGRSFTIFRQYSAGPGRLTEVAILQYPTQGAGTELHVSMEPGVSLMEDGRLTYTAAVSATPADLTPLLFMGQALDRSTNALRRAATQAGILGDEPA
jgi:hypothetical protein